MNIKRFLHVALAAMAALSLSCCGVLGGPKSVVDEHLDAWSEGEVMRSYSYFADELQNSISISEFRAQVNRVKIKSFKLASVEISGTKGTAVVEGAVTLWGGDRMGLRYELIQKDDEWEIWGYRIHPDLLFEED